MLKGRKTISALRLGSEQSYLHQSPGHPGTSLVLVAKDSQVVTANLILQIIFSG